MNKFEKDWNKAIEYGSYLLPERGKDEAVMLTRSQLAEFVRSIEHHERDKCLAASCRVALQKDDLVAAMIHIECEPLNAEYMARKAIDMYHTERIAK